MFIFVFLGVGDHRDRRGLTHSCPTRRPSDLPRRHPGPGRRRRRGAGTHGGTDDAGKLRRMTLEIRGVTKRFGTLVANDAISLSVARGEVLALLGENGAGKTTLMNILFGHYTADSGKIGRAHV